MKQKNFYKSTYQRECVEESIIQCAYYAMLGTYCVFVPVQITGLQSYLSPSLVSILFASFQGVTILS